MFFSFRPIFAPREIANLNQYMYGNLDIKARTYLIIDSPISLKHKNKLHPSVFCISLFYNLQKPFNQNNQPKLSKTKKVTQPLSNKVILVNF